MRTSSAILGILGGIAAGAIIGMLIAPDSGENTRKKITTKTQDTVDDLKGRFNALVDGFVNHKEDMTMSKNKTGDLSRKVHA